MMEYVWELIVGAVKAALRCIVDAPRWIADKIHSWLVPKCPYCGSPDFTVMFVDEQYNIVDYRCDRCRRWWSED